MPKYKVVDNQTGKTVEFDWHDPSTEPTEQDLQGIFADAAAWTPHAKDSEGLTGRALGALDTVGRVLGAPGAAVAGAVKAQIEGGDPLQAAWDDFSLKNDKATSFDDVLGSAGMDAGMGRSALGFLGDVVIDPMNLIPGRLVGKVGSKLVGGAAKVAEGGLDALGLGEKLIQFKGLDKIVGKNGQTAKDAMRLFESTKRHETEKAADEIKKMFGAEGIFSDGLDLESRQKIAYALDKGEVYKLNSKLQPVADDLKNALDKQYKDEFAYGMHKNPKIDNYITYLTKAERNDPSIAPALSGQTRFARDRNLRSLEEAKARGAIDDAAEIGAIRLAAGRRAMRTNDFFVAATENFGSKEMKPGWRKLDQSKISASDAFRPPADVYFPEKFADELEKVQVRWSDPNEASNFLNNMTKVWKATATTVNPSHHFVNFIGNMHNMWIGGMRPDQIAKGYLEGMKIAAVQKAAKDPREILKAIPQIKDHTPQKILEAMHKYEVTGTATQMGDLASHDPGDILKSNWNPLNPENKIFKTTRAIGTLAVEEPARIGYFLDRLRKGDSLEQAALKVKDVLFDYSELTDFEKKYARNAIPFYTWTRKNIPLQINAMLEDPRYAEKLKDFNEMWWNAQEGSEERTVPDWMSREGYVPGPLKGEEGSSTMMRMPLPSNDLRGWVADPWGELGGSLHPLLQGLIEGMTGVSPSSGIPVRTERGYRNLTGLGKVVAGLDERIGLGSLPEMMGIVNTPHGLKQTDLSVAITNKLPVNSFWSQMVAPDSGAEDIANETWLDTLRKMAATTIGLTPRVVSPEDEARQIQNNVDEYRKKLKQAILLER